MCVWWTTDDEDRRRLHAYYVVADRFACNAASAALIKCKCNWTAQQKQRSIVAKSMHRDSSPSECDATHNPIPEWPGLIVFCLTLPAARHGQRVLEELMMILRSAVGRSLDTGDNSLIFATSQWVVESCPCCCFRCWGLSLNTERGFYSLNLFYNIFRHIHSAKVFDSGGAGNGG